jgi:lipopolysaccharide export LptBFGC system permease protein LptF
VQAQIAALGSKPLVALTAKQREEKAKREALQAQLDRLLANPMLCPEVAAAANPPPPVVTQQSNTGYYLAGGVALTAAAVVAVALLRRSKK